MSFDFNFGNIKDTVEMVDAVLGFIGGVSIKEAYQWTRRKITYKKSHDIKLLLDEINKIIGFSELCGEELKNNVNNETINFWLLSTRQNGTLHTSYNDFIKLKEKLKKPNDNDVKEIYEIGLKIRNNIFHARNDLKKISSNIISNDNLNFWIEVVWENQRLYRNLQSNYIKD